MASKQEVPHVIVRGVLGENRLEYHGLGGWGDVEQAWVFRSRARAQKRLRDLRYHSFGYGAATIRPADLNQTTNIRNHRKVKTSKLVNKAILDYIRWVHQLPCAKEIARYYGLSEQYVHRIGRGTTLKHVPFNQYDWKQDAPPPLPGREESTNPHTTP